MTARTVLVIVAGLSAFILLNVLGFERHQRLEAVWECTDRCDPYAPVVPATRPPFRGLNHGFYCYCDSSLWHPDKVYQESAQGRLDAITSEPPVGWHL